MWRLKRRHISEPFRWDRRFKQWLRICQPKEKTLQLLAERDDVKITYLEIARELIFDDEADVPALKRLASRHFVQPRHRNRTATVFDNENYRTSELYDDKGRPKRGFNFQFYDRPSKETGEWPCLRIELKITGSDARRRLGIDHTKDLIGFDYESLWKRHLIFVDVDRERTGRRLRNQTNKTRDKTPLITASGYNVDKAVGGLVCRLFGFTDDPDEPFSIQRVVDQVGMRNLHISRFHAFGDGKDACCQRVVGKVPLLHIYIGDS
jgi:hypothetical protein